MTITYTNESWTINLFISYLPLSDQDDEAKYLMVCCSNDGCFAHAAYAPAREYLSDFIHAAIAAHGHRVPSVIHVPQGLKRFVGVLAALDLVDFYAGRDPSHGDQHCASVARAIIGSFERTVRRVARPLPLSLAEANTALAAYLQGQAATVSIQSVAVGGAC